MSAESPRIAGLYAITDPTLLPSDRLVAAVTQALEGGARVLQYRNKSGDPSGCLQEARALAALCRARRATFLVNDDVELAAACGADGVHLGRDDMPIEQARARLGDGVLIGVSCYNEPERARRAVAAGADYVAFGRFFPSRTKPQAVQADLGLLRAARREFSVPIVAIGGITPENGASLIAAGADALAVIEGIFGQADIRAAARRYAELFTTTSP